MFARAAMCPQQERYGESPHSGPSVPIHSYSVLALVDMLSAKARSVPFRQYVWRI